MDLAHLFNNILLINLEILHYILKSIMTSISVNSCFNVIDRNPRPLEFFQISLTTLNVATLVDMFLPYSLMLTLRVPMSLFQT